MKFGELKSKIETYLVEAYGKGTLKDNLFIFEQLVLNNKNITKIFFVYDELSDKKGLNENIANEFINESTIAFENSYNKIKPSELKELNLWVGHVKCENKYKDIDDLFSTNILTLESKIKSKKIIVENLKSKKEDSTETIKVPLKTMVNVANKTVTNFISSLNLSEQKELKKILNTPKETLIENYNKEKEIVLEKLEAQKDKEEDNETIKTIDQVLSKLQNEQFSELNFYKLKQLNEGL
jgi:hypothetical protein